MFLQALSEKRAKAVGNFLESLGVDTARISIQGMGMQKPLVPDTNEESRALNRRVEFLMYE